jgi:hypothetical protein
VALVMLGWSIFVLLALWWLHRESQQPGGGATWVYHTGDLNQQPVADRVRDWFKLAHLNFQRIYPWVLLGPYVAWLTSYFPLERGRLRQSLPLHLVACGAFAAVCYVISAHSGMTIARVVIFTSNKHLDGASGGVTNSVRIEVASSSAGRRVQEERILSRSDASDPEPSLPDFLTFRDRDFSGIGMTNLLQKVEQAIKPPMSPPELPTLRPLTTLLDLLAYGAVVGLAHSVHFYRRYRERERQALQLESNLAKARLGALQAQLQPHFLFNSLNAIVTLVRRDPRAAEATLTSLSELLRLTLSQSDKQEVTLGEELQFVQRYLEIQQTRFGDRLRFEQNIQPAILDCLVPTLLLQPLVENAIRHGIEPSEDAGLVRLSALKDQSKLVLTVEDNGAGLIPTGHGEPSEATASKTLPPPAGNATFEWHPMPGAGKFLPLDPRSTGIGLANLRARLETLYGSGQELQWCSPQEGGFRVRIKIPFRVAGFVPPPPGATTGS